MNKLKQAIISKIHGLPWEEARWVEFTGRTLSELQDSADDDYFIENVGWWDEKRLTVVDVCDQPIVPVFYHDITLSRVLQALYQEGWEAHDRSDSRELTNNKISITLYHKYADEDMGGYNFILEWKLLKEDKSTATLEDQSEETVKTLKLIFNK